MKDPKQEIDQFLEKIKSKDPNETEFLQAVEDVA